MFRRLRSALSRTERDPDPLVKVAGMPSLRDGETCLGALEAKGIESVLKDDPHNLGSYELWVRASLEPQARLVMGLSGRSVIRLAREQAKDKGREKKG